MVLTTLLLVVGTAKWTRIVKIKEQGAPQKIEEVLLQQKQNVIIHTYFTETPGFIKWRTLELYFQY